MTSTNTRDVQALANPKTFKERDAWMRAVLASNLSNGVMRLAVRLALHLNVETGRCDPGYDALSSELRLSRRSKKALAEELKRLNAEPVDVPADLADRVKAHLVENPATTWSGAVEAIIGEVDDDEESDDDEP
jgi:hypothetical protein